jgi:hypothetical protein
MLAALGFLGAFLVIAETDPDRFGPLEPEPEIAALHMAGILVLWWMGVATSPLLAHGLNVAFYYPVSTATAALATAQAVRRFTGVDTWHELGWLGSLRSERVGRLLSIQSCALAALGVAFTRGTVEPATALTFVLASISLGLLALARDWELAALAGGLTWSAAWAIAELEMARRLGWAGTLERLTCAAGVLAAAFTLWLGGGVLRREPSAGKRALAWPGRLGARALSSLAQAVEVSSFAAALLAASIALVAGTSAAAPSAPATSLGVSLLVAGAFLMILLVPRWQVQWLVYLSQVMLVGAYVVYRVNYPRPIATDAIVLTFLGYIDLGAAEVLDRLRLPMYARPTRYFSLILPLLPLFELFRGNGLDDVSLFHLMAAATFYGAACGQMRWKSLGYTAAVLYNAALWLLWSRTGWKLADHPQYYFVPVGLSTILFAEVNHNDLDRLTVNAIRSVGLMIVYASLAVPLWQGSFGAWLALLIGSLIAVFLGIGLRLQVFLWMGLATFVADVVYQMGRVSLDYAFAKWAIMLSVGIALVLFVALNEKKRIVETIRVYYDQARLWE